MSTGRSHKNFVIFALMVTVVIDIMGVGLVFPIIPELVMGSQSILLGNHVSHLHQIIAYGVAMAAWPLGLFLGSPFLGELSDKIGRRKTLVICLFLTTVIYALTAWAIILHNFWLFLLGRFFSGYVGGAYEIAQATVADISPKNVKARNLGWIIVAASIGFVVGPLITSFTAGNAHLPGFGADTPFWIAAVLSLLNMISIAVLLRETYQPKPGARIHPLHAFTACKFIFVDKRVYFLGIALLLLQAGWGFYAQGIPLVLNQLFGLSTHGIGLFYGVMGLVTLLTVLLIQPSIFKRMTLKSVFIVFAIISGVILIQSLFFPTLPMQWIPMVFGVIGELMAYSAVMAMISNAVTVDEQGKAMGGAGAVFGLAWFFNALLISAFSSIHVTLPLWVGFILLGLSGVLMIFYKSVKTKSLA